MSTMMQQTVYSGQLSKTQLYSAICEGLSWDRCCMSVRWNQLDTNMASRYISMSTPYSTAVSDTTAAHCIPGWHRGLDLCLNPSKTQFMRLGSQLLLNRLDTADIPIMSSITRVQQLAHDLALVNVTISHQSPVLHQLHWLPVRQSVNFNTAMLIDRSQATWRTTANLSLTAMRDNYILLTLVVSHRHSSFDDRTFATNLAQSITWTKRTKPVI